MQPAYGIYVSQLVRMGRICVHFEDFCERNYSITSKLIKQGFRYSKLCETFKKFTRRHRLVFEKYGRSVKNHILDGVCLPVCALCSLPTNVTVRKART